MEVAEAGTDPLAKINAVNIQIVSSGTDPHDL
jgi:hypothetical protein